jgi:hypothetical protein
VVGVVSESDKVTLTALNLLQTVEVDVNRFWDWCVSETDVVVVLLAVEEFIALDATRVWEASRDYASVGDTVLGRDMIIFVFDITVKVNYASSVIDDSFADTLLWHTAHAFTALRAATTVTTAVTMAVLADIGVGTHRSADIRFFARFNMMIHYAASVRLTVR